MRRRLPDLKTSATIAVLGIGLVIVGCGGDDEVFLPPIEITEYTYDVTGSGGDCDELPRASGSGVLAVYDDQGFILTCNTRDLCDGETCREGVRYGTTITHDSLFQVQDGGCVYWLQEDYTLTETAPGQLSGDIRQLLTYAAGDCSGMTLPCDRWQTLEADECGSPCYDDLCAQTAPAVAPSGYGL